jgi:hypothetical protein
LPSIAEKLERRKSISPIKKTPRVIAVQEFRLHTEIRAEIKAERSPSPETRGRGVGSTGEKRYSPNKVSPTKVGEFSLSKRLSPLK